MLLHLFVLTTYSDVKTLKPFFLVWILQGILLSTLRPNLASKFPLKARNIYKFLPFMWLFVKNISTSYFHGEYLALPSRQVYQFWNFCLVYMLSCDKIILDELIIVKSVIFGMEIDWFCKYCFHWYYIAFTTTVIFITWSSHFLTQKKTSHFIKEFYKFFYYTVIK